MDLYDEILRDVNEVLLQSTKSQAALHVDTRTHLRRIDENVGRMALLLKSLADLCVRKGVLSREELAATMRQFDIADGVEDGKLTNPKAGRLRSRE